MDLNHIHIFKASKDFKPEDGLVMQLMSAFSYNTSISIVKRIFPLAEDYYLSSDFIDQDKNHIVWKFMKLVAKKSKMGKTNNFVYVLFDEKKYKTQIKKIVEEYS
jgi:recombinational DNA repair protein RecT